VRHRMSRRSIWALLSVAALASTFAVVGPAAPAFAASTLYSIQSSTFKVTGSPYGWSFAASRSGTGGAWSFSLTAKRSAHSGKATQTHTWNFNLAATDIVVSSNLATVKINTKTHLSAPTNFGKIVMHFTNRSKLHTVTTRCKKNNKVLFSSSSRTGKLAGSFDFKTNATGLPTDVKKTPIGVKVNKFVTTNAKCPGGGGGGGGGGGCGTSKSFSGTLASVGSFFSLSAIPSGKSSYMSFSINEFPAPKPATGISHVITVTGPAAAVAINTTSGNAAVSGGGGTPFLSNTTLDYTGGTKSSTPIGKCTYTTWQTDTFASGSLSVNFDTGAVLIDTGNPLTTATTNLVTKT